MLIFVLWARTILSRADFYIFRHAQCKNNAASFRLPPLSPVPKASPRRALPLLGEVPSAHTGERGLRTRTRCRPEKTERTLPILFPTGTSIAPATPQSRLRSTAPLRGAPRAWTILKAFFDIAQYKTRRTPPLSTSVIPLKGLGGRAAVAGGRSPTWESVLPYAAARLHTFPRGCGLPRRYAPRNDRLL